MCFVNKVGLFLLMLVEEQKGGLHDKRKHKLRSYRTMMNFDSNTKQMKIQRYLGVLLHVNVSMATADGSPRKHGEKHN